MSRYVIELPPDTLQTGDVMTIRTKLILNNPADEVWPVIQGFELESFEVSRAVPSVEVIKARAVEVSK